jgi:hypothetical protein
MIEEKDKNQSIFVECASDLIHSLLQTQNQQLIKELKARIIEIFNAKVTSFLILRTSSNALKSHSSIGLKSSTSPPQTETSSSNLPASKPFLLTFRDGMLTGIISKSNETRNKIKRFERICFIIFSGQMDKYSNRLRFLFDSMAEVIKEPETAHPSLLILVFS